jgi:hypothetical protein
LNPTVDPTGAFVVTGRQAQVNKTAPMAAAKRKTRMNSSPANSHEFSPPIMAEAGLAPPCHWFDVVAPTMMSINEMWLG